MVSLRVGWIPWYASGLYRTICKSTTLLLDSEYVTDCSRRATENRINRFPQWIAEVEDLQIQFVVLFSKKPDAIPILLIHGWPGKLS